MSLNDEEHLSSNHKKHSYLARAAQNLTGEDGHSAPADRRREVVRPENAPKTNKMVKIKTVSDVEETLKRLQVTTTHVKCLLMMRALTGSTAKRHSHIARDARSP